MGEKSKSALVPRLRFPGFEDAWATTSMSDLYAFKGNNSLSRDKLNYEAGELRNIHYGDIHTKFALHFRVNAESVPYINAGESSSAIRPENYCMAGDMVFADASEDMADIGKSIEIIDAGDVPLVSGLHTILARPNEGSFALGFGAYLFSSEGVRKQIQREGQGAKVLGLSATRLGNVQLRYPSKSEEQQKIADCLSSLDELIAAEAQKLDALKTHKKGLMQQLFPREGEAVPRMRFTEFRAAGEWDEKRLGEVGNVRMCKRILKEQTSPRGEIPFYKIGTFGGVPDAYISREIFESFKNSYPFPKSGAVLISAAGTIGRTVRYNGELAYFQDSNIVWLENDEDLIADKFLLYIYQLINWTPSIGAIQRLYNENILGAQVKFPSIPEQQKIAACLSSLDNLITAQSQRIDALKTHKKGLMQQLFPVLDEAQA